MQFVLSLLAIAAVVAAWGWVGVKIGSWHAGQAPRAGRDGGALPGQLPRGHRPPPGLGPLSPSERFLTQEAARGIRELELFLAEQPAV